MKTFIQSKKCWLGWPLLIYYGLFFEFITAALVADTRDEEIRLLREEVAELRARMERLERADPRASSPVTASRPVRVETSSSAEDSDSAVALEDRQQYLMPVEEPEAEDSIQIKGALRFNASVRDYDEGSKQRKGDSGFELFRIGVNGSIDNYLISAEYRYYPYMDILHHGWIGYDFERIGQIQVGVSQAPFGLLPYAAHTGWQSGMGVAC